MPLSRTNALLEALPEPLRAGLLTEMEAVPLPVGTLLYETQDNPDYAHFLTSGIGSVVIQMATGAGVEVGLASHHGFPEFMHILGPQTGMARCFMQVDGTGLRMDFKRFEALFAAEASLRNVVLRYTQYQLLTLTQLSACNRLHEVEARLARWLLMVQDRVGGSVIVLTQEFLAEMLGSRRSTVTMTAGALQRKGLIEYRRGQIHILDQKRLEATACECYSITRKYLLDLYK